MPSINKLVTGWWKNDAGWGMARSIFMNNTFSLSWDKLNQRIIDKDFVSGERGLYDKLEYFLTNTTIQISLKSTHI